MHEKLTALIGTRVHVTLGTPKLASANVTGTLEAGYRVVNRDSDVSFTEADVVDLLPAAAFSVATIFVG